MLFGNLLFDPKADCGFVSCPDSGGFSRGRGEGTGEKAKADNEGRVPLSLGQTQAKENRENQQDKVLNLGYFSFNLHNMYKS